jgi:TRAP-type C4-dicarboxylate transport system permease small subunit
MSQTVHLYGFIPVTKSRYIAQLVMFGLLAVMLLGAWAMYRPTADGRIVMEKMAYGPTILFWLDRLPWIFGALVILQTIEAAIVLRLFRRVEHGNATQSAVSEAGAGGQAASSGEQRG